MISPKEDAGPQETGRNASIPASESDMEKHSVEEASKEAGDGAPLERVETEYPNLQKRLVIMLCLCLGTFLVALDRTIVATAIPRITDEFNSIQDIGWYGSSYLLTFAAFQLIFGKIYTFYSPKWVYLSQIFSFEVGSIICAAAPTSTALIIGRAWCGLSAAGLFTGAIVILVHNVPLAKRPKYQGVFGAVFGVASVAGPLLGGVFTSSTVGWRFCFWINLPVGGVVMILLAFILHAPPVEKPNTPWKDQVRQFDPIGTACFLPAIVCLLLALQWGGSTYPWSDGRIIALLVLAGVLLLAFVGVQFWLQDTATIPPRILKQRSMIAGFSFVFFGSAVMMVFVYYIPVYFQAIKGASAVHSGIMNLPLLLSLVVASIMSGALVSKLGYYVPFMIASCVLQSVGAGLITLWDVHTAHPEWIGYQVLYGFGLGLGMMQPSIAAQTVLEKRDVPTGISIMFFGQTFGGSVFISVGQNLLSNGLVRNLQDVPGIDIKRVVSIGATDLRRLTTAKFLPIILRAYSIALKDVFYLGAALAAMTVFGALATEWKSVKAKKTH